VVRTSVAEVVKMAWWACVSEFSS